MTRGRRLLLVLHLGLVLALAGPVAVSAVTVTFREGAAGYAGTQDNEIRSGNAATSFGNAIEISADLVGPEGEQQVLIRFDTIFGNGAGQIPAGSIINSATLTVDVTNGSSPTAQITMHRMLVGWSEASTWNSMTNGIQRNDVEAQSASDATLPNPNTLGPHVFSGLAATVQAWSDGAANHGWHIYNNDGSQWTMRSSENATANERPLLTVDYTPVHTISGIVFEDLAGDAVPGGQAVGDANNPGRVGVTVGAYRDDGDLTPDAGDVLAGTTATLAGGAYSFTVTDGFTYWVLVDSKTVPPGAAFQGGATQADVWAEQTFGAAGALCSNGAGGTTTRVTAGPCYGGRRGGQSDDASSLDNAEHLVRVTLSGSDVSARDVGFSFRVLCTEGDGDDDLLAARTKQGSLRQFLQNANALAGAETVRFVPASPPNAAGSGGTWWSVGLTSALPTVTDAGVTVEGTAYDLADGATVRNTNAGTVGTGGTVGVDLLALATFVRPELEVDENDQGVSAFRVNTSGAFTLRNVALFDNDPVAGGNGLRVTAAAPATMRYVLVGARADGTDPGAGVRLGAGVSGDAGNATQITVQDAYVAYTEQSGLDVQSATATTIVERSEFNRDGRSVTATTSDGAEAAGTVTVTQSLFRENGSTSSGVSDGGAGLQLGRAGAGLFAQNTLVENCTFRDNTVSGLRAYRHVTTATVRKNVVTGNGTAPALPGAGIALNLTGGPGDQSVTGVRITQNRIGTNAGLAVDIEAAGNTTAAAAIDGVTVNDAGDGDTGANTLMNLAVLDTARIDGTDLVLWGWARPGSEIELFIADGDGSGFGEIPTYLLSRTEGSGSDLDAGTGAYGPGAVNGHLQGTDTTNRFRFRIPLAGLPGVARGTVLSATATDGAGNTSECSGNVTVLRVVPLVKRAFLTDGTPLAGGASVPKGTPLHYLLYINNRGALDADVTLADVLQPAYAYQTGTLRLNASVGSCASDDCTPAEVAAIYAAVSAAPPATDGVDGDALAYAALTVHAGNGAVVNQQLDSPAGKVLAVRFTVRVQ